MSLNLQRKYLLLMGLTGLVVCLDQLTKLYVHTQFELHQSIPVIQNFFHITYVRNYGAAFGFLSQAPDIFRQVFFMVIPLLACVIILYLLRSVRNDDTRQILALSSVFAGAIGNYLDRLQFRYVIDFVDFHYGALSWPAFNIADVAIVAGVMCLLFFMLQEEKSRKA